MYYCTKCTKSFKNRRQFKQHTSKLHKDMSCYICKKWFLSKIPLDKHKKKPHIEFLHGMDNETESNTDINDLLDSDDMFTGMT